MRHLRHWSFLADCALFVSYSATAVAQATCTLNPTNQTVTICTPGSGATVGTTFHVNGGVNDSNPILYMQVYVANKLYASQHATFLDATITVPAGTHQNLTLQAKESSGLTIKTTYYINVVNAPPYAISPLNPTVTEGTIQVFTANAPTNWASSCGGIDGSGNFTAPLAQVKCTVTGTATDGSGHTASTSVNVSSPIAITPGAATTVANQTQQFSASLAVTWAASCGTIDGYGLFTAPATASNCTITATASSGTAYTAQATDSVTAAPYTISPTNPTVTEGATQVFTATAPTNWASTCGSIDGYGNFVAPFAQSKCTVTGTATDGSGSSASASVAISSPLSITPSSASTVANATQQFSANLPATWTTSCGSIDGTGLFTAPASPATCIITATASGSAAYTTSATDTVTAAPIANVNYTTWKNDNARDGWQPNETVLTPANVNASTFGQLFTATLDGWVWAQPLYMSGVQINSAKHNVVYVATANDSVYAIDGDNGQQLWKTSLLAAGETPANGTLIQSSVPKIGVTGTPVIDPATGTLYAVTQSVTTLGSNCYHRLHALDITTGAEKFGAPLVISPPGWTSPREMQRPGLLLANGNVYVAFGSNGDVEPYNGWVFAYNAGNLNLVESWNATPAGGEGGIWMGGAGIAADTGGNLYLSTGNGDWNGSTQFGQSIVKLDPSLALLDYFTPYNHVQQSAGDKDLGSGGMLLLPDTTGPHVHEMISCSKLNTIYVLDRDNLGQIGTSGDVVVQQVNGQLGGTSGVQYTDRCFSTVAYWNNNLYIIGNNDVMKQFTLDPTTGLMSTAPVNQDTFAYLFPGGQPVVSSNGNTNAIVWATDWTTGTLHAYDATNVSNVLYVSPKIGGGIKFTVPTVVNGHVYVGLQNSLVVMGLLPNGSCPPPSAPGVNVCAPVAGGTYSSPVAVTAAGLPANGTLVRMELWVDGKKIGNYTNGQVQTSVPLPTGSHTVTVVEVDSTGGSLKQAVPILVQ
jgi:hypothetical protein